MNSNASGNITRVFPKPLVKQLAKPLVKPLVLGICIFLIAFLVYSKTINFKLTGLDDTNFVEVCAQSYAAKSVWIDAFKNDVLFGKGPTPYYRPVLSLSFAASYKIAGTSEKFAHLINVLLHCVSAVIVFFFTRRYIFPLKTSFLAALLFAVHPAAIYAAAWIPGRNDSIFFIAFFAAFIFFIEYLDKKKLYFLIAHIFFTLVCFFTKESGIMLPFVFLFYYFTHKEKGKSPSRSYQGVIRCRYE